MKPLKNKLQTSSDKSIIENRLTSRRQFLMGAGKTLLFLPPLLSLLPREVLAQVTGQKVVRYVGMVGQLGIDYQQWAPANQTDLTMVSGQVDIGYKPLNQFSGPISRVIHTGYKDLYADMNVISGMSLTAGRNQGHNKTILAGAHTSNEGPSNYKTIDVICEQSPSVYRPGTTVARRCIRVSNSLHLDPFSFDRVNGNAVVSPRVMGDLALFNAMMGSLSGSGSTGPTQSELNRRSIVDQVYQDLKDLEGSRLISRSDKEILDRYISSISDLQKKVSANSVPVSPTCTKPNLMLEVDISGKAGDFPYSGWGVQSVDKMYDNYIEIFKIAAMCDLTRVMHWGFSAWDMQLVPGGSTGGLHHEAPGSAIQADRQGYGIKKLADLARAFKSTPDPINGGNLLENSIIFYINELGAWTTSHNTFNIPTITFGQGGGKIRSGNFVDCRQRPLKDFLGFYPGRPVKQFLQAVMATMGVTKEEYSPHGDSGGFGRFLPYVERHGSQIEMFSQYASTHNDPLPFVYKG